MPHFRVDDALHSHPKAQRAGDEALGMWARAGSFCMAYLTDGFVPEWWVRQQPKGIAKAKKLIAAGLWLGGAEHEGEQGFRFHEFVGPGRQDSRSQIEADREKWRKKKAAQRGDTTRESPGDKQGDSPGDTTGESPQESRVLPNTNPTPTEKNSGCEPDKSPVSGPPNAARGTRIGADWMPPPAVVAQMRSDHPHVDLKAEHLKFIDYWQAKPGKDGRKTDWDATWRNWIRRADERRFTPRTNGHHGPALSTSDQRVAQTQALKTTAAGRLELE